MNTTTARRRAEAMLAGCFRAQLCSWLGCSNVAINDLLDRGALLYDDGRHRVSARSAVALEDVARVWRRSVQSQKHVDMGLRALGEAWETARALYLLEKT